MFRHPKYYKKLRKRNKTGVTATTKRDIGHSQELSFGFPPPVNSDQIISPRVATASARRASDPGLKLPGPRPISNANKGLIHRQQATSTKPQASSTKLNKKEATSLKPQAASLKLQAASYKLHDS